MSNDKELAYRYDLFVTPDWRDRFDRLINESITLPASGRVLDLNCGTGAHAIELAERMRGKGEVIGIEPSPERVEIAQAKAQVKKISDVSFHRGLATELPFEDDGFDLVIGDASMMPANDVDEVLAEMVRVAAPDAMVILKMATRGSFDEFFSLYWEALLQEGLVDQVWRDLERLINERMTVSDAEQMADRAGLREVNSLSSKEEFFFETGREFIDSPLIRDNFLAEWLEIVPEERREEVEEGIVAIIERERHDSPFDISIKATLISGIK
jgi:ubiquinone/menaquinone biosynthesis C-methylase UbiE